MRRNFLFSQNPDVAYEPRVGSRKGGRGKQKGKEAVEIWRLTAGTGKLLENKTICLPIITCIPDWLASVSCSLLTGHNSCPVIGWRSRTNRNSLMCTLPGGASFLLLALIHSSSLLPLCYPPFLGFLLLFCFMVTRGCHRDPKRIPYFPAFYQGTKHIFSQTINTDQNLVTQDQHSQRDSDLTNESNLPATGLGRITIHL